ncbi:hypothetical protein [Microlunatus sp. Gsoil 973]|nr:hypothetical protein [Microlunatus sp. Gsoil 973]QGN31580.1 hypothetical protein GJV80_00635 [Microlunatus sp. Gsoil 973]
MQYVDHYPSTPGVAKTIAFQNNGDIQDSGVMIYKVINSKITVVGPN